MTNNTVEFHIDKELDADGLEIITLYLESTRRSGGGPITSQKLDKNKKILTVNFEDKAAKERILSKRELTISGFTLKAVEILSEENCEKNRKILIFTNLKSTVDKEAIELYAEHIVLSNKIKNITESRIFPNTFYIQFENDVDLNAVNKRRVNHSKLFGLEVTVLEAFKTNSVIGKFENHVEESIDYLELHFTNVNKSGVKSYQQLSLLKNGIYLVRFNDYDSVKCVLEREQVVLKNKFILDEFLNFNLIDN